MDKALENPWPAVGAAIRARLGQLPESEARLCKRMGVSSTKFRQIRNGEEGNYRASTLARISLGLWGDPEAIEQVMAGKPPTPKAKPVGLVSTGWGDLNELERLDPTAYASVMDTLALHLDRARKLRGDK